MNNNWFDRLVKIFDRDMVCHYTGEENVLSILKDKQIRFSPFWKFDDPRESKQWNFDFIGAEQKHCYENYKKVLSDFDNLIKNKCRILAFCGWNNEEMNFQNNAIPPYRQDYYRVGFTKSRMWSQYGDKHKGACLVFSRKKLEEQFMSTFEGNKKFTGRVEYQYHLESFVVARKINCRNIIEHGINKALEMQLDKFYHEYFFLKMMDYRDEHEYRLGVIVDDGVSVCLPIESSLEGVIVGVDFPKEKYGDINALAKNCSHNVQTFVLDWQEGRPQLMNLWEFIRTKSGFNL